MLTFFANTVRRSRGCIIGPISRGNPKDSFPVLRANLSAAWDERGSSYFGYDAVSRPTSKKQPDGLQVSQGYGDGGERTTLTLSPIGTLYYAYDPVRRMTVAKGATAAIGSAYFQYTPDTQVSKKILGNGCYSYFAYDAAGRTGRRTRTARATYRRALAAGLGGAEKRKAEERLRSLARDAEPGPP